MIVVVVAEEHEIDAGKIVESHAWRAAAARTDPSERTGALRPNGIGQDVEAAMLDQDSGMVDECDVEGVAFHGRGRLGWSDVRYETGEGPGRLVRFQRMASRRPRA